MALKAASKASTSPSGHDVPEVPEEIPRGRGGRPKIRVLRPDGTDDPLESVTYTRASTLGKALENQRGLDEWRKRMVAWGIGHDRALHLAAASVATTTEQADKEELGRIADEALTIARAGSGAMVGTAFHTLSDQRQQGASLAHLPADVLDGLSAYERLMAGFEVVAMEQFVVCDSLEAAGTYDRLLSPRWPMTAPDGTVIEPGELLIDDTKSNRDASYFGPTYACQQAVYANGVPYSHKGGRGQWPGGRSPRTDWSLIMHVPMSPPRDADESWRPSDDAALWWVNLREGYELAELARLVRAQTNRDDLFVPCDPPREPTALHMERIKAGGPIGPWLIESIREARTLGVLSMIYECTGDQWTDEHVAAADERASELERAA